MSEIKELTRDDLKILPPRDEEGNKGTFGKVLAVAGSWSICGAAYLCGMAALRTGVGMVKIYTEESNRTPLAASFPEALISTYREGEWDSGGLQADLKWADTVLIGPGIGTASTAGQILDFVLANSELPLLADADALNILAEDPGRIADYPAHVILTPHVMEMSRLTSLSPSAIKTDPVSAAKALSEKTGADVVLKDASTVIAACDGSCWIYRGGTSALATAGSGDVLAGMIAGLMTAYRSYDLPYAALGVCLHGTCGELAAAKRSRATVIASDLFEVMPALI